MGHAVSPLRLLGAAAAAAAACALCAAASPPQEKRSDFDYNLACILTLPQYQRKGCVVAAPPTHACR